jgi:hypothetical protein
MSDSLVLPSIKSTSVFYRKHTRLRKGKEPANIHPVKNKDSANYPTGHLTSPECQVQATMMPNAIDKSADVSTLGSDKGLRADDNPLEEGSYSDAWNLSEQVNPASVDELKPWLNRSYNYATNNSLCHSPQVVPLSSLKQHNAKESSDSLEAFMAVVPRSSLSSKENSSCKDAPEVVPLTCLSSKEGSSCKDSAGVVVLASLSAEDSIKNPSAPLPTISLSRAQKQPFSDAKSSVGGDLLREDEWTIRNREYIKSLKDQRVTLERMQEEELPTLLQERAQLVQVLADGYSMSPEEYKDYQWKKIQLDIQITQLRETMLLNEKFLAEFKVSQSATE